MPSVIAIAAHPDDIEFVMAGTLLLLRQGGWEIHYLNVARGNLGSATMAAKKTARVRRVEAERAARVLGATWHPPICGDLQIFYDDRTLRRIASVIREVAPVIVLTHSEEDYMEDHMNTARLAVTAAFARGMPSYPTIPNRHPTSQPVTIYHANPHGLRDRLRQRIVPGVFVDTTTVHAAKRAALACHASQKEWLDVSQGMDSYLVALDDISREVGRLSKKFTHAEGWRRHSHLGFCSEHDDPLRDALGSKCLINAAYERALERPGKRG